MGRSVWEDAIVLDKCSAGDNLHWIVYNMGSKEGMTQGLQTAACKFLEMGLSVDQIVQGISLSLEQVNVLKEKK